MNKPTESIEKYFGEIRSSLKREGDVDLGSILTKLSEQPETQSSELKEKIVPYILREITRRKLTDVLDFSVKIDAKTLISLHETYGLDISSLATTVEVTDLESFNQLMKILENTDLPLLKDLIIFDVPINLEGTVQIANSNHYSKLEKLTIWNGNIGVEGAIKLVESPNMNSEIKLILPINGITPQIYIAYLQDNMSELGRQNLSKSYKHPNLGPLFIKDDLEILTDEERAEFNSWISFPNSSVARNLLVKEQLGNITDEEQAELNGWRTFPNSSVARNLLVKEQLGNITDEEQAELNGWRTFPNSSVARNLLVKEQLGNITDEEQAELNGWRTFPNSPIARNLLVKEQLGNITDEEQIKLDRFRALRNNQFGRQNQFNIF